jgi:CDP-glucose 4,6-dehydratase
MIEAGFWKNRRVFITGHTGFKGSWLSLMLHRFGAKVTGYAQKPPTDPNLFEVGSVRSIVKTVFSDIRDLKTLKKNLMSASPEIVIHLAAQPLVRESYANPWETYSTNVMGTVNILEGVKDCKSLRAVVIVTSDKCYENREWIWSYRENEPLGGFDPYSSSKACSEIVTAAYRNSFFNPEAYKTHQVALASARAGNVIGGGDWAKDRLIPDCIRAVSRKEKIIIRNPNAIRPWQHVFEPLTGYLMLAEKLYQRGPLFGGAWNFGPNDDDPKPVAWIAKKISSQLGASLTLQKTSGKKRLHEDTMLRLDSTKVRQVLGWHPKWGLEKAVDRTMTWYKAYMDGQDMRKICNQQIEEYLSDE